MFDRLFNRLRRNRPRVIDPTGPSDHARQPPAADRGVLDQYEHGMPSAEAALPIFAGEWASQIPDVETFGGRWAPAVAAYNAGEVQARLWLDQCGPGCTNALYLQNISFGSTRSYTAGVLSAAVSY